MELLPPDDGEHGLLVAETVGLLNRASRYPRGRRVGGGGALGGGVAPRGGRDSAAPGGNHQARYQRRVEENRRALLLGDISDVTRARHLAWLAYNLMYDEAGQQRAAANEAAATAASTGDLEARILAGVTLACLDCGDGYADRALRDLEELCALARTSDVTAAHLFAANYYANQLAVIGRLDDAAARVAEGTAQARREGNAMALDIWAVNGGMVHLAAGRLSAARAATESLPAPERAGVTELDMVRGVILAEVAARTDDRTLLQQMVSDARDAYSTGSSVVDREAAHVLALAAWQRDDVHDAMRWLGGDITVFGPPVIPRSSIR